MATGPATVVQAVASARDAADRIERLLGGGEVSPRPERTEADFSEPWFLEIPRGPTREAAISERVRRIDIEDAPGASIDQIEKEAARCFNCGCLAVGPSDIAVALVALDATIITTKRRTPAQAFFTADARSSTILEPDEVIKEIVIPKPRAGTVQRYEKFTLRKPIDFAVVSVASVLNTKDGVCKDARIVLGAVAPSPLRARSAEHFLKGRQIDETSADRAADLALEGALPLRMNLYKIQIAKALVKRALVGSNE